MNWHLGRYQFPSDDLRFLLCGAARTAYVALTGDGDLIEMSIKLKPKQALELMHRHKVRFEKTLHAQIGPEAPPALQVSLDLLPARSGAGYADGQNTYPRAKRQARARAFQSGARKALNAAASCLEHGKTKDALNWLERFREAIANAWLEAEGYLPWLAITHGASLDFALRAYANEATLEPFRAMDSTLASGVQQIAAACMPLNPEGHLDASDVVVAIFNTVVEAQLKFAEALAAQIDQTLLIAESRGWPMIDRKSRRG